MDDITWKITELTGRMHDTAIVKITSELRKAKIRNALIHVYRWVDHDDERGTSRAALSYSVEITRSDGYVIGEHPFGKHPPA